MKELDVSSSEVERLQELKSFAEIKLHSESVFSDTVRLAAFVCDAPIAMINFVEADNVVIKAKMGIEVSEIPRKDSFCGYAISSKDPLVIEDASLDPRFADKPFRFYVGIPLITSSLQAIGTLCVLDKKPRQLTDQQIQLLVILGKNLVSFLQAQRIQQDLKKRVIEACQISDQVIEREWVLKNLYEITSSSQFSFDQKIDKLLQLGVGLLQVSMAALVVNQGENCIVTHVSQERESIKKGLTVPLKQTFCQLALQSREPVSYESVADAGFLEHPSRTFFGVECYLGVCLAVDDQIYGTINFLDFKKRKKIFSPEEKKIIQLISQWISLEKARARHLSEVELQQKNLVHASKMASLGEMAGNIAHEINNPLAMISGHSQLLRASLESNTMSPEALEKSLDKIDSTIDRILKVVNGLRSFSRKSDNDQFSSVSIHKIMEDTKDLCAARFKNSEVELRLEKFADIQLECRPVEITQVLMNLLNNAIDAVQDLSEKWVEIRYRIVGDKVELRVRDSGKGIPKDIQQKMMNPFFTTKASGKGTGLGLSISGNLVQSHQGQLYIDSEDQNTCFVILLPQFQVPLAKAQ